ncbi:hypothetical protein M1B72_04765 [Geomonas paludis]|uniref:Glycosyltransferase RgtA/B/C/D-like domain-containing protein n=1 Tax=Geomonas paludis TaxID=2740185 RepID=A0A6V8MYH1_9BACT|nr:hypothetical protein [Geomonas paludis]UPU37022.1 hypothetical protein M1B72_04765 [Geomonas paludis]GFO64884.1 hypothetical protein GMPD_28030 [Geomonas paludis]
MSLKRHLTPYLVPSIADLLQAALLCALFFTTPSQLLQDGDTGYHIRAGEVILRTGTVPLYDLFSQHAPPLPWTAHEWLAEVIMALVHQAAGMSGVVALYALLLALTFRLLFKALLSYGNGVLPAAAVTLTTLICSKMHWLARPHLFSFLFLVLFHYLLESWRSKGGGRLWLLPPLMLLWANLHGGFAAGFLLLGAYLAGTAAGMIGAAAGESAMVRGRIRQLLGVLLACLAATVVNPYGWRLLLFPLRLVSDRYLMDHVAEFLPPAVHGWPPFTWLLLVLITLFARSPRKAEPTELLLVLGFGYMALTSVRYIPLFGLVTAPALAARLDDLLQGSGRWGCRLREVSARLALLEQRARPPVWGAVAVAVVTAAAAAGLVRHAFDRHLMPVDAYQFVLRQGIKGKVFNSDEFGDYLIYRGYPDCRVFIDGRLDMYGAQRLREYNEVIEFRPGWDQVLQRYGIRWVIFEADSRFARFLEQRSEWQLVYRDKVAKVFLKKQVPR